MTKKIVSIILALPLFFALAATSSFAQDADYIIRVNYDGPITLHQVDVFLYDIDRACNTLVEDPIEPPSADTAWSRLVILPDAEGNIPDRDVNVSLGDLLVGLHYAIARATASDGAGGHTDYYVTFGCTDVIPPLDPTAPAVIEINMHNLWPEVEGTYRIDATMDLLKPIPEEFRPARKTVKKFFNRPGLGLLRLIAVSVAGEQYWQYEPWDSLFECRRGDCTKVKPTRLGRFATRIIEKNLDENLALFLGIQDTRIRELLSEGREILTLAESFKLAGNLVITQNPDSAGLLGNTNSLVFNQITWQWAGKERTLDLRNESFIRGNGIAAAVVFHPADPEVYSIDISPFNLSLNYGELLFWVLEGIGFPEFIDNEISSIEDIANLIDCDALSSRLLCDGPYANDPTCKPRLEFAAAAIVEGCTTIKASGFESILSYISGLIMGVDSYYYIGTPADDPCQMSFAPGSNDFRIHALGGSNLANDCTWEGEVRSVGSDPIDVASYWWGELL